MVSSAGHESDEANEDARPVFLEGGDRLALELRELAFGLLLGSREPVEPRQLAALLHEDESRVAAALDQMADNGRIDRDPEGRVVGSAGLTLAAGPHGLELAGHGFRTWCAFDALGIPAALASDARVESRCAVCGWTTRLEVQAGRPVGEPSARPWLSAGSSDMRADFCTPTVLLCSGDHAAVWAERQADHGSVLTLREADEGARAWRSAAATAIRLGESTARTTTSEDQ